MNKNKTPWKHPPQNIIRIYWVLKKNIKEKQESVN